MPQVEQVQVAAELVEAHFVAVAEFEVVELAMEVWVVEQVERI